MVASGGVEVSADTISAITDKIWPLVEAWQNRPLAAIYSIIYLDGFHLKLRRQDRVENVAVYIVLGVDLEGRIKTKASFPTPEAARKLLYLANQNITGKWTMPMQNWANILTFPLCHDDRITETLHHRRSDRATNLPNSRVRPGSAGHHRL